MVATKPEVTISQLIYKLATRIQQLYPCFRGSSFTIRLLRRPPVEWICDESLLSVFSPVIDGDVHRVLSKMPSKPSPLDAVPITLLKSCADVFVPIIVRLANLSFTEVHFPARYKEAQVMPLLKKSGLDSSLPSNYRPISNLSTISKVLERLVLVQLRPHLLGSANFSEYQSAMATEQDIQPRRRCLRSWTVSTQRQTTAAQCHHRA